MLALQRTSKCTVTRNTDGKYSFGEEFKKRKDGQGDLTITVGGQTTSVHRSVLMATSDYFKTMFSAEFSEKHAHTLDLSNNFEDVTELDAILDFMYTGRIQLTSNNIVSVLNTACLFLQTDLQKDCASFLRVNISPKTCVPIFVLADRYNLPEVQAICIEVMTAWFPVGLCHSPDVLDIPPHCLNVLIKENILKGLSDVNRRTFLQKWYEKFKTISDESNKLPTELNALFGEESLQSRHIPLEDPQKSVPHAIEEDVLFFVFKVPSSDSTGCCTEVHAFVPECNMWKFVLCHTFGDSVKPTADPHLVGITNTKAYFLFVKEDLQACEEECLISVNIQNGAADVIKLPEGVSIKRDPCYGGYPQYILWGDELCALFCGIEGREKWSLYKHVAGEEWEELIQELLIGDSDAEFITDLFNDTLYIWWKEFAICGSALAEIYYYFSKITKSTETGQYEICDLEPAIVVDAEGETYPEHGYSTLASVSVDATAGTLSYTHITDSNYDLGEDEQDAWHDRHTCQVLSYNTKTNSWDHSDACEVSYPDPEFTVTAPTAKNFRTKFPIMKPCKRLVVDDGQGDENDILNPTVKRQVPETCVGGVYYMKTTCPYNTSVWKLNVGTQPPHWGLLTHLPYSLDWFPHVQTTRVASDRLLKLPDSCFHDFSEEVGEGMLRAWSESAVAGSETKLEFDEELDPHD